MSTKGIISAIADNEIEAISSQVTTNRLFDYKMSGKSMKEKLIKGAKRAHFQIDEKQTCVNLDFSDGAFQFSVIPLLNLWNNCSENGEIFTSQNIEMSIDRFVAGYDKNGKHMDTKVTLSWDNSKITIHAYNSTQRIKVDGKRHKELVEKFFKPYFTKMVMSLKTKITQYDKAVIESLSSKTVKRASVKFKAGSVLSCQHLSLIHI